MKAEEQARADIVEVGRRLWERGYVASNDGNISVRLDENRLITTPKSVSKGFMTPDMMVITDLEGKKISGERDPSSELKMHLEVYRNRPDARAVVHAHPPTATGFRGGGDSTRSRRARRSDYDAWQYPDRRVRDAFH
jgi:L-fuculose-phosphate aldolase